MKKKINNLGFVAPKAITPDQYVLGRGNVPKVVLRPSGDWSDIPDKEVQNRKFETNNCTAFNTLSRVEKMVFVIDGVKVNYSDRFLGVVAGTYPPGNDPHLVAEAIRKYGCIPEEMMPFSDDLANVDEYYSWKGVDKEACLAEGRKWLEKWEFMHEWVFLPGDPKSIRIPSMVEALTLCPPAVAVYAWEKDGRGLYVDKGRQPNHWTGLDNDMPLEHWLVGDSYIADDSEHKKLDWFFNFEYCKRFHLRRREAVVDTRPALMRFALYLAELIGLKLKKQIEALPIPPVPQPLQEPQKPSVEPKYDWSTPEKARHSVRVICDEEGLTLAQKNLISRVIRAESGFNNDAKFLNKDKSGRLLSTDWGICQINDYWHIGAMLGAMLGMEFGRSAIGAGKTFPSVQYVLDNPDKVVRWMISQYRKGNLRWWVAYSSGKYMNHQP